VHRCVIEEGAKFSDNKLFRVFAKQVPKGLNEVGVGADVRRSVDGQVRWDELALAKAPFVLHDLGLLEGVLRL